MPVCFRCFGFDEAEKPQQERYCSQYGSGFDVEQQPFNKQMNGIGSISRADGIGKIMLKHHAAFGGENQNGAEP